MKKIGLFVIIVLGWLYGCEDALTMKPENSLTFENGLTTPKDFEAMLNSIDAFVNDQRGSLISRGYIKKGEYADAWESSAGEERTLEYPSSMIASYNMADWTSIYKGISLTNIVLTYVDIADLSREHRNLYRGQALFYKALFYFDLIRFWGDCILIRDDLELLPVEKTAWEDVAGYAIGLVEEAANLLPEFDKIKDASGNSVVHKSTPCKGTANALLAYLCAWKAGGQYFAHSDYDTGELWEKAEKACTQVIGSGTYALASNPEEVCTSVLVERSKESIFESVIRGFWNEVSGFEHPGYLYVGYPVLPWYSLEHMKYACTLRIKAESMQQMFSKGDLRRESYFYNLDELSELEEAGGFACLYKYRKYWLEKDGDGSLKYKGLDVNRVWWRLADIYLLRAECRARLGGTYIPGAIDDLNEIRGRAQAKLYDASEYGGDLRYTIFKEREKELIVEGHRYWDVIRNGYVRTELSGKFKTATDQDFKDGMFFLLIHENAFDQNPLLRQNTYWYRQL